MKRRQVVSIGLAVAMALALAVLLPGSPLYLANWWVPQVQHEGQTLRQWMQKLDHADAKVRSQALFAMGAMRAEAAAAIPRIAEILVNDPDRQLRNQAALALAKMDPASRDAVGALSQALDDPEPSVRMNAANALFRLKGEAHPAVASLIKAIANEDNQTNVGTFAATIQEIATRALGRASAGTDEAVPALLAVHKEVSTTEMRLAVAQALGDIGPPARSAAPALGRLLKDRNSEVRRVAEETLRKLELSDEEIAALAKIETPLDDLQLAEAERTYLWEIEHHGNLLVKHGFGPLADALRRNDAAALTRLLSEEFRGGDLTEPVHVHTRRSQLSVERWENSGRPPTPLSGPAFVARLLELRKLFVGKEPKVKLALMTLSPERRGELTGGWEGMAQLRMHGEHAAGAPAEIVATLHYRSAQPTEKRLGEPGWLRSGEFRQIQKAQSPQPLFAEVARQRGLDVSRLHDNWTSETFRVTPGGCYVCDFNRDGFLDLLITDQMSYALYQGKAGGAFDNVTARLGLPENVPFPPVGAWVDIDGDGWEDLILGAEVYRNEAGKRFTNARDICDLRLVDDMSGVAIADYDCDGKLDIYITRPTRPGDNSWLDGRSADAMGNLLLRNKGNWKFEDVTKLSGAGGGRRSTFTAAWLDVNNDGWPDLHVPNEFGDGVLLVNTGKGKFTPQPLSARPADFGTMGLACGDLNNDSNIDLYCANMYSKAGTRVIGNLAPDAFPAAVVEKMKRFVAGSQLHLNRGGLKFDQVGVKKQVAAVGWAYGASLADLDNDGWLDIYANAGYVSRNRDEPDG